MNSPLESAWHRPGLRRAWRVLSVLLVVAGLLLPQGLAATASRPSGIAAEGAGGVVPLAKTWPDCGWNCTAGDTGVTRAWLGTDTGEELTTCAPGEPVTAYLWVEMTGQQRYRPGVIADLYIGGALAQKIDVCFDETITPPVNLQLVEVQWTCGVPVELRNLIVAWHASAQQGCSQDCTDWLKSKCYGAASLKVDAPLVAEFTSDSPQCLGSPIEFTPTVSGGAEPYELEWSLGDGTTITTTSTAPFAHTYTAAGTFDVTLTVTDSKDRSAQDTGSAVVKPAPTAAFNYAAVSTCAPRSIQFTDASTPGSEGGSIDSWLWSFGDDQTSTAQNPQHGYAAPGDYEVSLTVVDTVVDEGCSHTVTQTVTVADYPAPEIATSKWVEPSKVLAGGTVTYHYAVTNTGSCPLLNVSLSDDKLGDIALSGLTDQDGDGAADDLAAGAAATGQQTATIVTDTDNVSTARGENAAGVEAKAEGGASVGLYRPALTITKVANVDTANVGETIYYTITVGNAGDVALTNVRVTDSLLGLDETIDSLAVGGSQKFYGSYKVTPQDWRNGSVENTAWADSDETEAVSAAAIVGVRATPILRIGKVASVTEARIGETIDYTITVGNAGDVALTNVVVTDALLGLDETIASLAVGASQKFYGSHVATEADWLNSLLHNTATADSDETGPVTAEVYVIITAKPGLAIEKTADRDLAYIGETINYTIVVTNTGDVALNGIAVKDAKIGLDTTVSLAAGASVTLVGEYGPLTEADLYEVENTATAYHETAGEVLDTVTVAVQARPGLAIGKTADRDLAYIGETINYTIIVTNTGDVALTNVRVTDALLGLDETIASLAAGASTTLTGQYGPLAESDLYEVENTATASHDTAGEVSDTVTVAVQAKPGLAIEKTADRDLAYIGETINYTIVVRNTGDVALNGIAVQDAKIGLDTTVSLAAGASVTLTGQYGPLTEADLYEVVNTATASHETAGEVSDTVTVPVQAQPGLTIVKTGSRSEAQVGDSIAYTIVVENRGDQTLTGVQVTDSLLGIAADVGSLAPEATAVLTGTYTVSDGDLPGPLVNTARATCDQLDPVEGSWTVGLTAPPPITPTPPPLTPTPPPPPPCTHVDVAVVIYGGWAGIPVQAWVGGTEQPLQHTGLDGSGQAAVHWSLDVPAGQSWQVGVSPQLPAELDPARWQYKLLRLEIDSERDGLKAVDNPSSQVSVVGCHRYTFFYQLVDVGPPSEPTPIPLLPVTGGDPGSAWAPHSLLQAIVSWWQGVIQWCQSLLGR